MKYIYKSVYMVWQNFYLKNTVTNANKTKMNALLIFVLNGSKLTVWFMHVQDRNTFMTGWAMIFNACSIWCVTDIILLNFHHERKLTMYHAWPVGKMFYWLWDFWFCVAHWSDITWAWCCLKSLESWLFIQQLVQANNRKHQTSTLLALCERNPPIMMDSPHNGSVVWKAFPCHDVIMWLLAQLTSAQIGSLGDSYCWFVGQVGATLGDLQRCHWEYGLPQG